MQEPEQTLPPATGTAEPKIRMMVVDDHEVVRRGLALVLSLEPDIEVIGEASNGAAAIELAATLNPNMILMDYKMPGMSGVKAGQAVKELVPRCRILILTGLDSDATIFDALENGVDGYVLKEITPEKLVQAVRIVARGGAYLDPDVTRKVLNRLNSNVRPPVEPPKTNLLARTDSAESLSPEPLESLTGRESEIIEKLALGYSNREIAEILILGEETVRTHLKSIYRKLGVNDRTQAVVAALKNGLINLN